MLYNMTMERTLRVALDFEAENDAEAEKRADQIFTDAIAHPEKFEGGDIEHDYALCDDQFRDVVPWR